MPLTGEISGTPSAAGTFNVVVTASDGVNSDSESFAWTIAAGPAVRPEHAAAADAGDRRRTSVTFQASVTGGVGIQYQWDFDDGTPRHAVLVLVDDHARRSRSPASTT